MLTNSFKKEQRSKSILNIFLGSHSPWARLFSCNLTLQKKLFVFFYVGQLYERPWLLGEKRGTNAEIESARDFTTAH